FVAAFGLSALAGLGVSVLQEFHFTQHRRVLALTAVALTSLLAFLLVYKLQLATQFKIEFARRPSFSRALLFAGLIPIFWKLCSPRTIRAFPLIACALLAFDLLTFSYGYMGFCFRDEIFPHVPLFKFLTERADPTLSRVVMLGIPYSS